LQSNHNLSDTFATLACLAEFHAKNKWPLENLHLVHTLYNLNEFLEISCTNLENADPRNYSLNVEPHGNWDFLANSRNVFAQCHISKLVRIKETILNKSTPQEIGIHFRCKMGELYQTHQTLKLKQNAEKELEGYKELFLKHYKPKEKYFVCTDSPDMQEFLNGFPNVTTHPKTTWVSLQKNRKKELESTILDLASLGQCNTIFKTYGKFANLASNLFLKTVRPLI
jgi:hypothetical protein